MDSTERMTFEGAMAEDKRLKGGEGRIKNVATKADRTDPETGRVFHSKREMKRYHELRLREIAGEISNLVLQPRFTLLPRTETKRTTIAPIEIVLDFQYDDHVRQETVVEDVKGYRTDVYKIKRKFFEAYYPQYLFREVK